MIKHDLKTAMRNLMKHKVQSAIAIVGLSLALVCFSACMYISRSVLRINGHIPNKDRIVELRIWNEETKQLAYSMPNEIASTLHQQGMDISICRTFRNATDDREFKVTMDDSRTLLYTLNCLQTDTLYNQLFAPHICYGSWVYTAATQNALVLTKSVAERIFGEAVRAIGQTFTLTHQTYGSPDTTPPEGGIAYTVTAVIDDVPLNTSISFMEQVEALTINDSEGMLRMSGYMGTNVFALVPDGERRDDFITRFDALQLRGELADPGKEYLRAYPMGYSLKEKSNIEAHAHIALVAGLMVLLVGLLNFFYFLTESYRMRIREYYIRQVNGASTMQLVGMLFTESAVYVGVVALISIGLIMGLLNDYHLDLNGSLYIMDAKQVAVQCGGYLLMLAALCAGIVGLMMYRLQRTSISNGLFGARNKYGKHPLRNGLLAIQCIISWVFVGLTMVLYQQSHYLEEKLFGTLSVEEKERTLSVSLRYRSWTAHQRQEAPERIRQCAGVEEVLNAPYEYVHFGVSNMMFYTDVERKNMMNAMGIFIDPEFMSFMHIPVPHGELPAQSGQMWADEKVMEKMGGEVLGKVMVDFGGDEWTVAGPIPTLLLDNYRQFHEQGPILCSGLDGYGVAHCYVKCRPGQTGKVRKEVEAVIRDMIPESYEPKIRTFMDEIHDRYVLEFKLRNVVLFMAIVTLMIAVLGIYSAITLDTERRQKEMVIRKINGAKVRHIALLFARMYMVLMVGTAAIAFPLIHYIVRMLGEEYDLYVHTDWLFYTVLFVSVALIVFVTIYGRIRKVARVNPAEAIKSE